MKVVFKYQLELTDKQKVILPEGAQLLTVQAQNESVCLWALVEPGQLLESRTIRIAGTGHPITAKDPVYISTFQLAEGALVFHAFEILED